MGRGKKTKEIVEYSSGDMVTIDEILKDDPKALAELAEMRKWMDANPFVFDTPKEKISQGQKKMKQLLEDARRDSVFVKNLEKIVKSTASYNHDDLKPLYTLYRVYLDVLESFRKKYLEKDKKAHPFIGFSMAHLTRSNTSFVGTVDRIPFKYIVNGGCDIQAHEKFMLTPRFYYANQAKAYEVNVGVLMAYNISNDYSVKTANWKIIAGADWRYKDAVIINLGVKQDSYAIRFSYDVNTSYLKNYTNGRGAWEISLVYTGEKGKSFIKAITSY